MSPDLPKTSVKFLIALLKNQAKLWLGEDAAGIAAQTFLSEDLQKRLDDWLASDESAKKLLNASQQAQIYLQDERNCPDRDLRYLFRDMDFGSLPSVQAALTELPQQMDAGKLESLLLDSFERDLPNLTVEQQREGARLYTDALLRAVGSLQRFASPIILQGVLDLKKGQHNLEAGQRIEIEKLDAIIAHLKSLVASKPPPSPTQPGDLPFGSYLPFPRNAHFTGRGGDLEKLATALIDAPQSGVVVNQAVTGMGGIGKTQLAVEFAYRYGYRFKGVHWLDLREAGTLDEQIAQCGSKMGLPLWPPTLPEQVAATLREWTANNPRLLILDNFEELTASNEVFARLRHSGLRLLITSRRTDWNAALGLTRLPLDEFTPAESLDFLRNYITAERESDDEVKTLAESLGRLPLALELAGRYLERQPRLRIGAYLSQLENALEHPSMQNWKAERKSLTGHDLSLLQTFARSWEQVKDETAQRLFLAAGYCAPNAEIPVQILEAALGDESERCDDCLDELSSLGLLKEENMIHPLLAQFARRLDTDHEVLSKFSEALDDIAEQTNHAEDQTGNYSLYTPILPHVRAVAELAEQAALTPAGSLWNSIGYHVNDLADYAGAKAAYERALKIDEAAFGPDHPNVAIRVNNLGYVLQALGDHAGAKAAYERALKIDEAAFGRDHPNVAIRVNNLGYVLQALGDHAGAKAAFERALKIDEAAFGRDHPKVAIRVNNLGGVLQDLGDYAGAKAAYQRALKIDEAAFGRDHPNVARDVNNLGGVLRDLGDHAGAKAAFERALKIDEAAFGRDHPNVAIRVNNLGGVLQDLGDHAGAKAAYERALKIFEKQLGEDHPNVKIVRGNLEGL
ncbi:MAG: Photosystem I assembly protein Ycf3 [Anaerolineales bacterium]|nr:Photosystem I assembly protein Ycf3 [Anaerolineales bacterium]